jgi:hypothetical protein
MNYMINKCVKEYIESWGGKILWQIHMKHMQ